MRHPDPSRRRRALLAAAAAVLAVGGLTMPASAEVGDAVPAAASAATTDGCGQQPGLTTGNHTITSGGQSRTFQLDVPAGYDPDHPYRLVVGLHWWHGTSGDVVNENFYGLKPLAGDSTVFVAPQGFDNAWPNNGGQDVAFVDDILNAVESALCIDTTQRFATGFSYGGGMSNALACARADVFRAVAVLNGAELSGCDGGSEPIAYLGSHGVVDDVLNISQGRALRDRFLQNNGCAPQDAPEPAPGSGQYFTTEYACDADHPVVWIATDSGHQWQANGIGVPGMVWDFFTSLISTTPDPDPTPTTDPTPTDGPTPTDDPTTTPPPAGACAATYQTVNSWPGGFQGEVTVTANSPSTSWSVSWQSSGESVDQVWNGTVDSQGDLIVVRSTDWNGDLSAGGSVTFGLLGTGPAPTPALTCTSS